MTSENRENKGQTWAKKHFSLFYKPPAPTELQFSIIYLH